MYNWALARKNQAYHDEGISLILAGKRPVVHKPAAPKVLGDQGFLILRRIQPVPPQHAIRSC
nr:hypothetical protein [Methanoculleus sp. UBA413]